MKLTVFVTVYNIAEYLPRFFESMAKQTYKDYVLLMIDDGSEDNSLEVCTAYSAQDSRIEVVHLEHVGIAQARNYALSNIKTEFTASADGDDYVEPDYLKHLMEAREKYDADLVVSRVRYLLENGLVEGDFCSRGEVYITKAEFKEKLPMVIEDRRLNFLYGKVYRTSLLKGIRVEKGTRPGSDTMINCQYIGNTKDILLIDDVDYNYIRYSTRSITSQLDDTLFYRVCRINKYILTYMEKYNYLSDNMYRVVDTRILQSAYWIIDKIFASSADDNEKARQIDLVLNNSTYVESYKRQKYNLVSFSFEVIVPQNGMVYLKKRIKAKKTNERKAKILEKCPDFIVDLFHKIKGVNATEE